MGGAECYIEYRKEAETKRSQSERGEGGGGECSAKGEETVLPKKMYDPHPQSSLDIDF